MRNILRVALVSRGSTMQLASPTTESSTQTFRRRPGKRNMLEDYCNLRRNRCLHPLCVFSPSVNGEARCLSKYRDVSANHRLDYLSRYLDLSMEDTNSLSKRDQKPAHHPRDGGNGNSRGCHPIGRHLLVASRLHRF